MAVQQQDLYFDDGNVVIEAQGTVFRVYRGLLSRHSPVFASMLALPPEAESSMDTYDGCAMVHCSDSTHNMEAFLKALYDYECVK